MKTIGGPQYTVVALKKLRPNDIYPISVTTNNIDQIVEFTVSITGGRDSNREQSKEVSFNVEPNRTEHVAIKIDDWPSLKYTLSITGKSIQDDGRTLNVSHEINLQYEARSFLAFIQTDKAIYRAGERIQFRAIFVTPSLRPKIVKQNVTITIADSKQNIIKHWTKLSTTKHGIIGEQLKLSEHANLGDWSIIVEINNELVARKHVRLAEYTLPKFSVDVKLPKYATYNKSNIVANVKATYTYGKPVQGHVTLTVQPLVRFTNISARPLNQLQYKAKLTDGYASIPVDIVKDLSLERDDFEREIEFFALVQEELTGHKYNKSEVMKIYNKDIKIQLMKTADTFKPGLNYLLVIRVAHQDNTPIEEDGASVKLKYHYRNSDQDSAIVQLKLRKGLARHTLSIPSKVKFISSPGNFTPFSLNLVAEYKNQIYSLEEIIKSESPSDNFMQIIHNNRNDVNQFSTTLDGGGVNIGEDEQFTIQSTEPMQQVIVEILARGNIVYHTIVDGRGKKETSFTVTITQSMSPTARVVCYYMRSQNREIVADALNLSVNGVFKTDVRISTSDKDLEPGKPVEIDVKTKPRSFVGISAVDQSVLLLRSGNDITKNDVLTEMKQAYDGPHNMGQLSSFSAKSIFDESNLIVITNGLLYDGPETREGKLLSWQGGLGTTSGSKAPKNGFIALDQLILEDRLLAPEFHIERQPSNMITIRQMFPETWLWANSTSDNDGLAHFKSQTPDTITSWSINAISINDADGLGLLDRPVKLNVFKQFFVRLNLPPSIIRGETIRIQAIIHNYSKRPTRAIVSMDNRNGDFEFVEAANVIEDEKRTQEQQQSVRIEIGAEEGKAVSFLVTPKKLGHLDVIVRAQAERFSDAMRDTILVKPEGQTQHFNKAIFVSITPSQDSNNGGSYKNNVTIDVPANAVANSTRVFLSAVGDIMSFSLNNLDDTLLRLPIDGGEQNTMRLLANYISYDYQLHSTNADKSTRDYLRRQERILRNIENGYQQQLTYKRQDGSFSEFGDKDKHGSTWLTAYILKALSQVKDVITVDSGVMQRALAYLAERQQTDGSFEELGQMHNSDLAPTSSSSSPESEPRTSIYLTAYVLIALIHNKDIVQKPEISLVPIRDIIDKGLDNLQRQIDTSSEPYELAIVNYVMQLATRHGIRQNQDNIIYSRLKQVARQNDQFTWWSTAPTTAATATHTNNDPNHHPSAKPTNGGDSLEREFDFTSSVDAGNHQNDHQAPPPLKPLAVTTKHSEHLFVPDSLAVEMTSYAIMAILLRDDPELDYAMPVARWLVSQQNSNGGFASTQDTVLALEALSKYQLSVGADNGTTSLDIDFSYANPDKDPKHTQLRPVVFDQILIKKSNSLVHQLKELPNNTTWVNIEATGQGSAVLQLSWQYNLLVSAEAPSFFLNPQLDKSSTEYYLQLSICSYYKAGESSNMAVMEIDLPSGYVAEVEALPSITRTKHIKQIYLSQQDTHLSVYFDKVSLYRFSRCLILSNSCPIIKQSCL